MPVYKYCLKEDPDKWHTLIAPDRNREQAKEDLREKFGPDRVAILVAHNPGLKDSMETG